MKKIKRFKYFINKKISTKKMSIINQLAQKNKWSYISEEELSEIYESQYNDVFSKILQLDSTQFINVLEKQIIVYLYLIKKQPILSSLSKISELYIQKYYKDREKVYQAYQIIKHMTINEYEFLDKLNCFIHCHNSSAPLHTCGNKFILCNDYIFCLQCKKVFNEFQARMLCDFCKVEYYTKLREIKDENSENFFPICLTSKEKEIIKCKKCNEILLCDITKFNSGEKKINLTCKKCKNNCTHNLNDIKLFNDFTKDKIDILCLIHTLLRRKYAYPKDIKKSCVCEINTNRKYKHYLDKGNLLEGLRQGKKVIICDKCFQIFDYKNYNKWECPECGLGFNEQQGNKYNTAISNTKMKSFFKEKENNKNMNNNIINSHKYNNIIKDNKEKKNLNKINISESIEQFTNNNIINKNNNNKTSVISFTKESNNESINNNKSKRIVTSKLLSQENRLKRSSNNTNSNSNIIASKNILKKGNSKNKKKINKEQNNKINNSNIIKIDINKGENINLATAKSSINIHSNNQKYIQNKNAKEKSPNTKPNENIKIEIIKRNYSLDKNKEDKEKEKDKELNKKKSNNILNNNKNKKIQINEKDKVIQRNKGSPNHKRVDIVETRVNKNRVNNLNLSKINNIQSINIKFSHDLSNMKSSNNNNLNVSQNGKELKENNKPLYKSINMLNNNRQILDEKIKIVENRYDNNKNQIDNVNNIYINDKEDKEKDKEKNKKKPKEKEKEKDVKKNDASKNISSEGYQFNCDNYNIVQLLGEGTFGKIYLVEDPDDFQKYALKKISVSDMEELNDNKKEFELLMKLSQENPALNVVKIFGIQVKKLDKFNLVMYVLMEAAQCDWECEIRNRSQYQAYYTEEELMKIILNLSTTLASLQRMGICHRDVKPQNILCFGKDNYKLSDFGEAKKKKKRKINGNYIYDFEGDTSKQTVRGTELYMSPILFKALHDCPEVDLEYNAYKSDVFSLGLCMLLASTLGFQALYDIRELYDHSKIKKIVDKYLNSRYSKDYIKLIISMLQIKEKNRPDFIELENNIQQNYYHKDSNNKDK